MHEQDQEVVASTLESLERRISALENHVVALSITVSKLSKNAKEPTVNFDEIPGHNFIG